MLPEDNQVIRSGEMVPAVKTQGETFFWVSVSFLAVRWEPDFIEPTSTYEHILVQCGPLVDRRE